MAGIVPSRDSNPGDAHSHGGGGSTPLLMNHGGVVQAAGTLVQPIFWGTSWAGYSGDKINGLDAFYKGVGGTKYANTNTEYTESVDGLPVSSAVSKAANDIVDTSASPTRAPSTSTILNEVVNAVGFNSLQDRAYYPVYIDHGRGSAGYCAWHSAGTVSSGNVTKQIEFGFFFNLDGDSGCDVSDSYHSVGLASLGNVSGHELSEMVTDPQLNAWYDSSGSENADKCAWHFSGQPVVLGGQNWTVQGNWSNAAYGTSAGYYNRGCIDGNQ